MNGFKSQQHRWTKGSIQTCKKLLPRDLAQPGCRCRSSSRRPGISCPTSLTCCWRFFAFFFIPPPAVRSRLDAHGARRRSDFSGRIAFGRRLLHLRPAGAASRTWMKEILFLPCLLALGVGLSLNNRASGARGGLQSPVGFHADPKYGIEHKSQHWRSCNMAAQVVRFRSSKWPLAIYFSYFVCYAITHGQFFSVPFLLMFQGGFLYVCLSSLRESLVKIQCWQFTRKRCNSRVTTLELSSKRFAHVSGHGSYF